MLLRILIETYGWQSSPAAVAAEAGKDELPGHGVPVEVDGHASTGVEARTQGDMEGEEARNALVGRAIVGGIADLGVLAEIAPEVAEPDLRGQVVVQLEVVGGVDSRRQGLAYLRVTSPGAAVVGLSAVHGI